MNTRHPGRPRNTQWQKCKVTECLKTTEGGSRGFCHTHYIAAWRRQEFDLDTGQRLREPLRVTSYGPGANCSVPSCDRRAKAGGLCSAHWQRQRNGLSLDAPVGPPRGRNQNTTLCCVSGCQERANNRGMCPAHAQQRRIGLLDEEGNQLREKQKGGRPRAEKWIGQDGYVLVKAPENHPRARHDGSVLQHRLVMEQKLGRYLEEWEIVHHKDGDRQNNDPSNLELLDGRARRYTGPGHPPGHEFDWRVAVEVLLSREDLPENLRQWLEWYRANST